MWTRVEALVLRNLYLYRRSLARAMEIFFWPVMDLMVWGFVTVFLKRFDVPNAVLFLIGAMILWDVLYRSQQAITLGLLEEIWVKNVLNVFVSPAGALELSLATCIVGAIKTAVTVVVLATLAYVGYAFNLFDLGLHLLPFLASLLLFGWAVGMMTSALIIRFGHAAEALTWGVPFLLQPLSAVFYPVDVLPPWLRVVSLLLPSTHVFEGMRAVLVHGTVQVTTIALALLLNAVYLGIGAAFFAWMVRQARQRGYLSRLGME